MNPYAVPVLYCTHELKLTSRSTSLQTMNVLNYEVRSMCPPLKKIEMNVIIA